MVSNKENSNNNIIESLSSNSSSLLTQLYSDLASPSIKKVGKALESVFDFGYVYLALPLQYKNDKKRFILEQNFQMYKDKVAKLKDEDIVEVLPELGVPLIQRLTYKTNEELADLFTNLLVSASSKDKHTAVHPTFLRILDSISVDEARILKYFSARSESKYPYIKFVGVSEDTSAYNLTDCFTEICRNPELILDFPENEFIYIDNLISLGLLTLEKGRLEKEAYHHLESLYKTHKSKLEKELIFSITFSGFTYSEIITEYGYYEVTRLGIEFFEVCIVDSNESDC